MRHIVISTIILFLIGCATSPQKKDLSKKFVEKSYAVSSRNGSRLLKEANCPRQEKDWKKARWQEVVKMANACVVLRKWGQVLNLGNHLASQNAESPWGAYYLSLEAEAKSNYLKAEWMVELALKKSPSLGILYYQKARIFWKQEKYEESVALFEQAVRHKVNLVDSYLHLGKIFLRDMELGKASGYLESVLKVEPRNREALINLAKIHTLKNDEAGAISYLTKAVESYPKDSLIRIRLAESYEKSNNRYELALDHYMRAKNYLKGDEGYSQSDLKIKITHLRAEISKRNKATKVSNREPAKVERK